jgi:hypothetical protein
LLGFDLVEGNVAFGLIQPAFPHRRYLLILKVFWLRLLSQNPCPFWDYFKGRECLALNLLFGLVLPDDGGGELGLIGVLRKDPGSALGVSSQAGGVEESMCKAIFVVGTSEHSGRFWGLPVWH